MGSGCLRLLLPLAVGALVVAIPAPARAGEPSARELIALAPVLDSSDRRCRSLDVGGWLGGNEPLAPKIRFRALYNAPNRFSLLISDAKDGTPLVFCSGRRMFVYDPVGPTVYYSEAAGFTLELACTSTKLKFGINTLLKNSGPHRIVVDFRSLLLGDGREEIASAFEDRVVRRNIREFRVIRSLQNRPYVTLNVDLTQECPYTGASIMNDGSTCLCLDKIVLNGASLDDPFTFPAKRRLFRVLPVKDVTADENPAIILNSMALVGRATVVRAILNSARSPEPINIPGLAGVNWDRVKDNDKKFAKALRDLVPPSLRSGEGER